MALLIEWKEDRGHCYELFQLSLLFSLALSLSLSDNFPQKFMYLNLSKLSIQM